MLDLFRPFKSGLYFNQSFPFLSNASSPKAASLASLNQIKRLVVFYTRNFPPSRGSFLWHVALLNLANSALDDPQDSDSTAWFNGSVSLYHELSKPFGVAESIAASLVSMAVRDKSTSLVQAQKLLGQLSPRDIKVDSQGVMSSLVIDLNLAMTNPISSRASFLLGELRDAALLDEFTSFVDLDGE